LNSFIVFARAGAKNLFSFLTGGFRGNFLFGRGVSSGLFGSGCLDAFKTRTS
jgi:hypothetical protein